MASGTPPRYRLLEAPRALAREQLVAAPGHAALAERHARAVARWLIDACADTLAGRRSDDDFVRSAGPVR